MRDIWFVLCVSGLAALLAAVAIAAVINFLDWRAAVNREAWWRHVTGIDG